MNLNLMNVVEVVVKYVYLIDIINNLRNMKMILQNGKKNMEKVEENKDK